MSGYVASARIVRAAPRLARPARAATELAEHAPTPAPDVTLIVDATAAPDRGPTVAERWAAVRERWSQLTFFLLDANSWR